MQWNFPGFYPVDRSADDSGEFVTLFRPKQQELKTIEQFNFEQRFYYNALRLMSNQDKQYAITQGLITPELVDKFRTE